MQPAHRSTRPPPAWRSCRRRSFLQLNSPRLGDQVGILVAGPLNHGKKAGQAPLQSPVGGQGCLDGFHLERAAWTGLLLPGFLSSTALPTTQAVSSSVSGVLCAWGSALVKRAALLVAGNP